MELLPPLKNRILTILFAKKSKSTVPGMSPEAILEALIPGYGFFARLIFNIGNDIPSSFFILMASLAFGAYAVPAFRSRLQTFILVFAASVEIRYNDELYNSSLRWISRRSSLNKTQHLVASARKLQPWDDGYTAEDTGELTEEDHLRFESDPRDFWTKRKYLEKLPSICYTPAPYHLHHFIYKGCWIALRRQPYENIRIPWAADMEKLHFYAAPWRTQALKSLLSDIQESSVEHDNRRIVIRRAVRLGSKFEWTDETTRKPRPLSTIITSHKQKEEIIGDLQNYLNPRTRQFYQSRGFPYQRGYLLYGPPGTGKSSLCLALAGLARLPIYLVSPSATGLEENSLASLFRSLPEQCIVLFEDIDQAGIRKRNSVMPLSHEHEETVEDGATRAQEKGTNGITLSAILNVLDGVSAQEGRILFMTTNHIEDLDHALVRPGRVDMKVFLGHADQSAVQEQFLTVYLKPVDELVIGKRDSAGSICPLSAPASPKWALDDIVNLSSKFASQVPSGRYTAAEIQNYLLQYKDDPASAVNHVNDWLRQ
jgi:chaperone BCS1